MKYTIVTINDNGSGMEFETQDDFMWEILKMIADCRENGGTYFHIEVDSDVSCFLKDDEIDGGDE